MFDTEEAQIEDFESFIRQARITAGYLASVPTESITQTVNDWSWRNLGGAADPSLFAGLNLATQISKNPSTETGGIRLMNLQQVSNQAHVLVLVKKVKIPSRNVLNKF